MRFKRRFSLRRCRISSLRSPAHELFFIFHISGRFQGFEVAGQVAVGQAQHFLEGAEFHPIVDHQQGHNAQPDAIVQFGGIEFFK